MHSAPAVSYPVGRSHFQACLLGLTVLGGVLLGLLWFMQADSTGWRQWLFGSTLLGTGGVAAQAWWCTPRGRLSWDGQAWTCTSLDRSDSGVVAVHLDVQFCMLISLRTETGKRLWLWPQRSTEVALWSALRRAAFSRAVAGHSRDRHVDPHRASR